MTSHAPALPANYTVNVLVMTSNGCCFCDRLSLGLEPQPSTTPTVSSAASSKQSTPVPTPTSHSMGKVRSESASAKTEGSFGKRHTPATVCESETAKLWRRDSICCRPQRSSWVVSIEERPHASLRARTQESQELIIRVRATIVSLE